MDVSCDNVTCSEGKKCSLTSNGHQYKCVNGKLFQPKTGGEGLGGGGGQGADKHVNCPC